MESRNICEPPKEEKEREHFTEKQINDFIVYAIQTLDLREGKILKTEPTLIKYMKDVLVKGQLDKEGIKFLGLASEPKLETSEQKFQLVVDLAIKVKANSVAEPLCKAIFQLEHILNATDRLHRLEKNFLPLLDAKREADAAAQSKKKPVAEERKGKISPPKPPR